MRSKKKKKKKKNKVVSIPVYMQVWFNSIMQQVITQDAVELAVAKRLQELAGDTGKVEVHTVRKGHKDAFYSAHFSIVSDFTRHSKAQNDTLASSEYASMTGWRLEDMFAYMLEQGFEINHIGHTRHSYHGGVWYGKTPKPEGKLDIMWTREL